MRLLAAGAVGFALAALAGAWVGYRIVTALWDAVWRRLVDVGSDEEAPTWRG